MKPAPYDDLIGVPFVRQGHDPATGLDCFGLLFVMFDRWGLLSSEGESAALPPDVRFILEVHLYVDPVDRAPGKLGDVILIDDGREHSHVDVVVGRNVVLRTAEGPGVHTIRLSRYRKSLKRLPEGFQVRGVYELR